MDISYLIAYLERFSGVDLVALLLIGAIGFLVCRAINREAIRAHKELSKASVDHLRIVEREVETLESEYESSKRALVHLKGELEEARLTARIAKTSEQRLSAEARIQTLRLAIAFNHITTLIPLFQAYSAAVLSSDEIVKGSDEFIEETTKAFYLASELFEKVSGFTQVDSVDSIDVEGEVGRLAETCDFLCTKYEGLARKYLP